MDDTVMNVLSLDPWACVQASAEDTFLEVKLLSQAKLFGLKTETRAVV